MRAAPNAAPEVRLPRLRPRGRTCWHVRSWELSGRDRRATRSGPFVRDESECNYILMGEFPCSPSLRLTCTRHPIGYLPGVWPMSAMSPGAGVDLTALDA